MVSRPPTLAERVRFFVPAFDAGRAPLYLYLTMRAAVELERPTQPFTLALQPFAEERPERFVWLRVLALVHGWVLAGELPKLEMYYPSAGGAIGPVERTWEVFRDAVVERRRELPELLSLPHQHNELGRAAALAAGFLLVSRETGMPLRTLEVGASAGLLLRWDHYLNRSWFTAMFEGEPPAIEGQARVLERRGCDLHPVDASTPAGALYLRSMVWADLVTHVEALDEAIALCATVPAPVDQADGANWLDRHAIPQSGAATVVYHSLMRASGPHESLSRIVETVWAAGEYATTDAPFAYLRFEPPDDADLSEVDPRRLVEVRLRVWPGGQDRLLATCDVNGRGVRWLL